MDAAATSSSDEVARLRGCISSLVSVLALPAIWSRNGPQQIVASLLDVLLRLLELDFAYARLVQPGGGPPLELLRRPRAQASLDEARELGKAIGAWLANRAQPAELSLPNPLGRGEIRVARLGLGLTDELGWVVAASRRPDFPSELERLLLGVAVNQAAIGLHEARVLSEQKRIAEELDRQVALRTHELEAAVEQLGRSEAQLAEAQRLSLTGSYTWHVPSGRIHWSAETYRIFEADPARAPTFGLIRERVHPEDLAGFDERVASSGEEASDGEFEFRLRMPEGRVKHLRVVRRSVRDESGRLVEVVGALRDITAEKLAFDEIRELKDRLQSENVVLREEVDATSMFEEIVGASPALAGVLARLSKVAPTDSTVLITGPTGTGKELIARAIHKRSARAGRAFVAVNCAAIPAALIASELFGHEKGAFTGALQKRPGRFELAHGGTLYLDEIGELPSETQIALLRVLQEGEFERVGGTQPIRCDVRLIAATNRDLAAAIEAGRFRSDLFYRVNVFPIEMPPLRARREDIPMLAEYFIHRYARKLGKSIQGIRKKSLDLLVAYYWPGNVRELQNIIERSVILCESDTLSVDPSWLAAEPARRDLEPASVKIANDLKAAIEAALAETRGRVSGSNGAAVRLGMPASTLESKIRALGIDKRLFRLR